MARIPEKATVPTALAARQFPGFGRFPADTWPQELIAPWLTQDKPQMALRDFLQDFVEPGGASKAPVPDVTDAVSPAPGALRIPIQCKGQDCGVHTGMPRERIRGRARRPTAATARRPTSLDPSWRSSPRSTRVDRFARHLTQRVPATPPQRRLPAHLLECDQRVEACGFGRLPPCRSLCLE